jgi:hypothetical protein
LVVRCTFNVLLGAPKPSRGHLDHDGPRTWVVNGLSNLQAFLCKAPVLVGFAHSGNDPS